MNKNNPNLIDEQSRLKIKNNIDENYFVEAGAGSGKTTALVDRMVTMIRQGKDISHISAITFTKAAANEFYDRFQKKLIEESLLKDEYEQLYLNALNNIDLAFMGTIDSFCNKIMSEHPNEGLIPSNSRVIDNDEAQELYKKEYANIQNGLYQNKQLETKAKLFLDYNSRPEETFIYTLNTLLQHRDCKMVVPSYSNDNIDIKYKDSIKTVKKIVNILNNNPNFFNCKNEDIQDELINNFKTYQYTLNNNWQDNIPNILNAYYKTLGHSELRLYLSDEVEDALKEGIDYFVVHEGRKQYYELNPDKLPTIINEIEFNKYAITLDFVNESKELILARLRKQGLLTFNDYLVYLRDTLRNDAANNGKLIKHIYERHKYFLIDEFQDTDPIQAEIFFYLAAKDIKPNWLDCIPHKGSLFIVGDPKQSIYRFKNADVASYLKVEKMFKQPVGEVLYLYKNFRSTYEIRDWFNNTFKDLLQESNEQAQYTEIPIDIQEKTKGVSNVYRYDIPYRPETDEERDEYVVRDIILKLYNNPDYPINTKDNNTKLIDWNDFMLITPSKPSLAKYTSVFRQAGIPYYVEGNIKFDESKAFELFVSYFGAVINTKDNRYLYQILKSNLYKIKESEISDAIKNGYILNISTDISNLNLSANLDKALKELKEYNSYSKHMNPVSLFTKIINNIDGFKIQGNQNMEYVYFALELLKSKVDSKQIITHLDALAFFETLLYKKNEQERCPGLRLDGNQVHLANLHKVKGLEAPVVILAHPNSSSRAADFRMVRQDNGDNKGYLLNVTKYLDNGSKATILETNMYDDTYKLDEEESMNAEKLRLEYVAATRAKNILIISNAVTSKGNAKGNPWADLLSTPSSSNLNNINDVLADVKAKTYEKAEVNYDSIDKVNLNLNTQSSTLTISNPSKVSTQNITEDIETDPLIQKQLYENKGDTYATIIGTMVHRLMELIVLSKDKISKDDAINSIINDYLKKEFIDKEAIFRDKLDNVYETIHKGGFNQKGKAPKDILPILLKADKVYSEVPFEYRDNDTLWNGIIDLIYITNNQIHIIDWKTNKDDTDLDNHYKDQLGAYKKAVKQTLNLDSTDAYIYHIDLND